MLKAFKLRKTGRMYFIDPNDTYPTLELFQKIKGQGFDSVAVRITEDGTIPYSKAKEIKTLADKASLKFYAWIWDGFTFDYIRLMVSQGIHILVDEETYEMESKIPFLKTVYGITKGLVEFIVCVKAQGWDGGQAYQTIVKYCDYLMPMLYLGDYNKSVADLVTFVKLWNSKLGGKLWACLETYIKDGDYTPKTQLAMLNEINAVINYVKGVALFRYGKVSNFLGFNIKPAPTKTKTLSQILSSAKVVAEYIQKNQKVPSKVTVDDAAVNITGYTKILAQTILNISTNKTGNTLTITDINTASSPAGGIKTGQLQKKDYLDASTRLINFINKNKKMPAYVTTPLGNLSLFNLVDMWSRALKFYSNEKILPNYITVQSVGTNPDTTNTIPNDIKVYLQATKNCQVNDSTIQAKAKELKTADKIFKFVQKLAYYMYYNTRYGAIGTLKRSNANCCDQSHLFIALCRAAGIPARYRHGYCHFSDGWYGHVWAQAYVNGKWVDADCINDNNSLGKIVNWNIQTVQIYNTYKELPF